MYNEGFMAGYMRLGSVASLRLSVVLSILIIMSLRLISEVTRQLVCHVKDILSMHLIQLIISSRSSLYFLFFGGLNI